MSTRQGHEHEIAKDYIDGKLLGLSQSMALFERETVDSGAVYNGLRSAFLAGAKDMLANRQELERMIQENETRNEAGSSS